MRNSKEQKFDILTDPKKLPVTSKRSIHRIYVHCSASSWGDAEEIHHWHINRENDPFYMIGYHAVVNNGAPRPKNNDAGFPDGIIQLGRPIDKSGAHVGGDNSHTLGVCLVGNFDHEDPMKPHRPLNKAFALLVATWLRDYDLPVSAVRGHRECGQVPGVAGTSKTCPGKLIPMEVMREYIKFWDDPFSYAELSAWYIQLVDNFKKEYPAFKLYC